MKKWEVEELGMDGLLHSIRGSVRDLIRVLREDLWTRREDRLPPIGALRPLRRLPHVVLVLTGIVITFSSIKQLDGQHLAFEYALVIGSAQGGAVVLGLRRPIPAWWLSTGSMALGDVALHMPGPASGAPGFTLPWTVGGFIAQALVLLLLALRVRTRVSVEALVVTIVVTYVFEGLFREAQDQSTASFSTLLFIVAVVLGVALRGRREARAELGRQNTLTEEERARRMLLEERSRIARELHDVVAHHMSVISIQAQAAPYLVEDPTDELKESLSGIRQNALEALAELRQVLGVLRSEQPGTAKSLGGPATGTAPHTPQPTLDRLGTLVDNTRASGLTVTLEVLGERRPLLPGVELSAYRIVQEALSNVLRHAPGATADVRVEHVSDGLHLRVVNSRPERPAPPSPGAGHGLLGMHERAAMHGGSLTAYSLPDGGYQVSALLLASPPGDGSSPGPGLVPGSAPEDKAV